MLSQGKELTLSLKAFPRCLSLENKVLSKVSSGYPFGIRSVATVKNSKATESSSRNEELFKLWSLSSFI